MGHILYSLYIITFLKKKKIQNIFRFRNFGWSTLLLFGLTAYSEIYFSVLVIGCISCHTNNKRYTLELCVRNDFFGFLNDRYSYNIITIPPAAIIR